MTSTAVAPTNAAQAGFTTSGTNSTKNTSQSAGSTSSAGASQLSLNNGLASLADNFQGFLTLLTTQLKNQDPTSPLDTNQFTQQITQMTGVEQQLLSNKLLQQLVTEQTGVGSAAGLIGDTVTAAGATSSDAPVNGVVSAVGQTNGQTMLTVGSNQVPLSSLTSVTKNGNSLASLLGG
jgi:flagellar basal-body rod modification protein FlgD